MNTKDQRVCAVNHHANEWSWQFMEVFNCSKHSEMPPTKRSHSEKSTRAPTAKMIKISDTQPENAAAKRRLFTGNILTFIAR